MLVIGGFGRNSKVEVFQSVSFKNGNALQRGEPCGSQSSLQWGHCWPLCPQQGIFLRRQPLPFLALVGLKWPEPLSLSTSASALASVAQRDTELAAPPPAGHQPSLRILCARDDAQAAAPVALWAHQMTVGAPAAHHIP